VVIKGHNALLLNLHWYHKYLWVLPFKVSQCWRLILWFGLWRLVVWQTVRSVWSEHTASIFRRSQDGNGTCFPNRQPATRIFIVVMPEDTISGFPRPCCWKFEFPWVWRRVVGSVFPNVSKNPRVLTWRTQAILTLTVKY